LLLTALCVAVPLAAQPDDDPSTGPQTVLIKLKNSPQQGPRELVIGPHAVATCKGNRGCADHFFVRWVGQKNAGEKIQIEFTTPGAGDCFDKTFFTVDDTGKNAEVMVTVFSEGHPLCKNKTMFFYDVSCVGGENGDCGGVEKVDPGAMVGGGSG
jgi:hypothetical protein